MTELPIILGSSLVVGFIVSVYAYGKLVQKIEHIDCTTSGLTVKFDNHLNHETKAIQKELSSLRTEIVLLNERIVNLSILFGLVDKDSLD